MPVKKPKITRTTDVVTILQQYMREHDVVAYKRTHYAVKALKRFFTNKHAGDVNIPKCREYLYFRLAEGVSEATVARELTTLRAACNHALKWQRITLVDMPVFEIPSNLPKREIWLFKDELLKLITAADEPIKSFIRLTYGTGSRRRAIEELEWSQTNFARKTINLSKPGERKTNKKRPTVPMGDLYGLLMDMYDESENQWVLGSNRDLLYDFEKTCDRAGMLYVGERDGRPEGKITPHILRHSRATHLLEDGASIYSVAKLLGDTPLTVQRTYGHISMGSLEDELSKSTFQV